MPKYMLLDLKHCLLHEKKLIEMITAKDTYLYK